MSGQQARRFSMACACCRDKPPVVDTFNLFHAFLCGVELGKEGIPLDKAQQLVARWNKAADGQFFYKVLED